jgi:hypothetical protein
MNPINLLPLRERLWQRQKRWWRQRWAWTLGVSLAVWAGLAALLAWHHQHWVDANALLQAQIEAQAPQRAQHQRLLQGQRQWQEALQGSADERAALFEPWHSWQALAKMAAPQVRWERMVWDGQTFSASGQALQASVATQLQAQWQQRLGSGPVVQALALKAEPILDPEGAADNWWQWEWRWSAKAAADNHQAAPSASGAAPIGPPGRSQLGEGLRP